MRSYGFRWLFFFAALAFLLWNFLVSVSPWAMLGFGASGGAWYWLAMRKAHELDARNPR